MQPRKIRGGWCGCRDNVLICACFTSWSTSYLAQLTGLLQSKSSLLHIKIQQGKSYQIK